MLGAAQPSKPGADLQSPDAEIQVPPDGVVVLLVLARHRLIGALRADQLLAAQRDPDHDSIGLKMDLLDHDSWQVQQARECSSGAHERGLLQFDGYQAPANLRSLTPCASPGPRPRRPSSAPGFADIPAGQRHPLTATPLHHKHAQNAPGKSPPTYTTALTSTKPLLRRLNRRPSHLRSSMEPHKSRGYGRPGVQMQFSPPATRAPARAAPPQLVWPSLSPHPQR